MHVYIVLCFWVFFYLIRKKWAMEWKRHSRLTSSTCQRGSEAVFKCKHLNWRTGCLKKFGLRQFSMFPSQETIAGRVKLFRMRTSTANAEKETLDLEIFLEFVSSTNTNVHCPIVNNLKNKQQKKQQPTIYVLFLLPFGWRLSKQSARSVYWIGSSRPVSEEPLTDTGSDVNRATSGFFRRLEMRYETRKPKATRWM